MSGELLPSCVCEFCKRRKDVAIPAHLLDSLKKGDVVIFAGAGASTEDRTVFPSTFYEEIARELDIDPSCGPDFPTLMSQFCAQPNGRQKLLKRIKRRFDYARSFPEIYRSATKFHRELSTIHQIKDIITTNWDDYFENECGAVPYVYAEDFAMWDLPGRKVFKIHGSINALGSIVATNGDYESCYHRLESGLIGGMLKTMLATKTILYVGYSFLDGDFRKLHDILTSEMKGMRPHSYIVTLDEKAKERADFVEITPIISDAQHFLSLLKGHLEAENQMLSDKVFNGLERIFMRVYESHLLVTNQIEMTEYPAAILTASYQDGLMHALEHIFANRRTGEYSHECAIQRQIIAYDDLRRRHLRRKSYTDVAYIDGFQNGLLLLLTPEEHRKHLPIFYIFGLKDHPKDILDYEKVLPNAPKIHKSSYAACQRLAKDKARNIRGVVMHHVPFLD